MKSKIDWYIVEQVREKRLRNNWAQKQLAMKLKVSVGFIGQVESKNYPAHYDTNHLNKLSKIFECSPRFFLPKEPL